jgi:hypothetical protein
MYGMPNSRSMVRYFHSRRKVNSTVRQALNVSNISVTILNGYSAGHALRLENALYGWRSCHLITSRFHAACLL